MPFAVVPVILNQSPSSFLDIELILGSNPIDALLAISLFNLSKPAPLNSPSTLNGPVTCAVLFTLRLLTPKSPDIVPPDE